MRVDVSWGASSCCFLIISLTTFILGNRISIVEVFPNLVAYHKVPTIDGDHRTGVLSLAIEPLLCVSTRRVGIFSWDVLPQQKNGEQALPVWLIHSLTFVGYKLSISKICCFCLLISPLYSVILVAQWLVVYPTTVQ